MYASEVSYFPASCKQEEIFGHLLSTSAAAGELVVELEKPWKSAVL